MAPGLLEDGELRTQYTLRFVMMVKSWLHCSGWLRASALLTAQERPRFHLGSHTIAMASVSVAVPSSLQTGFPLQLEFVVSILPARRLCTQQ